MIGRFSHLGTYRELMQSGDFYRASLGGILALASYIINQDIWISYFFYRKEEE